MSAPLQKELFYPLVSLISLFLLFPLCNDVFVLITEDPRHQESAENRERARQSERVRYHKRLLGDKCYDSISSNIHYHADVVAVEQDLLELGGFPSFGSVLTIRRNIKKVNGRVAISLVVSSVYFHLLFRGALICVRCTYNSVTSSRTMLT